MRQSVAVIMYICYANSGKDYENLADEIQALLVPRLLCRYGRKEYKENRDLHKNATSRGYCRRSDIPQGVYRPIHRRKNQEVSVE